MPLTLQELRESPERMAAYREWLSHPVTELMLRLTRENAEASFVNVGIPLTTEAAARLHNLHYGRMETLRFLETQVEMEAQDEVLRPMYGAEELLEHDWNRNVPGEEVSHGG